MASRVEVSYSVPTHTSGIRHDVAELTERLGTGVAAMTEQLSASLLQYSHVAVYRVDELAHLARLHTTDYKYCWAQS